MRPTLASSQFLSRRKSRRKDFFGLCSNLELSSPSNWVWPSDLAVPVLVEDGRTPGRFREDVMAREQHGVYTASLPSPWSHAIKRDKCCAPLADRPCGTALNTYRAARCSRA